MADEAGWDAETLDPEQQPKKDVASDNWDDEDVDDDAQDTSDDEGAEQKKAETVKSEKKPLETKEQNELKESPKELEESKAGGQQEEPATTQADAATGVPDNASGIDGMSPSSKDDFSEFENLLQDKLCPFEKSVHYPGFLESLFQDLCISLEIEDLKKINSSISVLLGEKQKQEKQLNKGKKKKKGVVTAGGLKAKLKDDLADYGQFEGGYTQDYEDFM
ncbi:hypothetical protein CRUP_016625 [Coryphaenoides rupestris]|nr:hypothetical protein CRUP_016625 [Coryphaenoides rupestris]